MSYWVAGAAIGGQILGAAGGIMGNSDARDAARAQAKATYATRMEEIKRAKEEQMGIMGENIARVGASNVQFSGTTQNALSQLQSSFSQDISWRKHAATMERKSIRAGAPGGSANFAIAGRTIGSVASTIGVARNG